MPRNSSGVYTLPSGNPVVSGTTIESTWANATMTDVANELSNSIDKAGRTSPIANLPMNGFKHVGAAAATALPAGQYIVFGQTGAVLDAPIITGLVSIQVPTGVDQTGGSDAASQQYVEVAASRAATEVIPTISRGAEALAIFNFMGA